MNLFKKVFSNNEIKILAIILLIGFLLRIYNLPYSVGFDFDQEYASTFVNSVVYEYPIQLIGQGLSVQGLFMGPWYFYYLVPFFMMTEMHPLGGYIGSIILGLFIILAYYYLGKLFFNSKIGLVLALFRAVLFSALLVDWSMVPSYSSELILLLTLYFLYKFWHGSKKSLMPVAFLAGFYTSMHPILFPIMGSIALIIIIKRKNISLKYLLISIFLFILPIMPLIRFEMLRNFLEVKQLFMLSETNRAEAKTIQTLYEYIKLMFNFSYDYLLLPQIEWIRNLISLFFIIILGNAIFRKKGFWKDKFHSILLISLVLFTLLYYFILPIHASIYYFLGANLVLLMYTTATLCLYFKLNNKIIALAFGVAIIIIFAFNAKPLIYHWTNPSASLGNKESMIKYMLVSEKNNEFDFYYSLDYGQHYGYGELLKFYKNKYDYSPIPNSRKHTYIISSKTLKNEGELIHNSGILFLYRKPAN